MIQAFTSISPMQVQLQIRWSTWRGGRESAEYETFLEPRRRKLRTSYTEWLLLFVRALLLIAGPTSEKFCGVLRLGIGLFGW
jgi:hypothetical protein